MREERIVYSLPFKCPIPWPVRPSYAIAPPTTTDLEQAYSNALYHQPDAHNLALDSFARLLLQLLPSQPRDSLNSLLRSLVLPIHDFDLKYRSTVPEALAPPPALGHEGATDANMLPVVPGLESGGGALSEHEKAALLGAHARWLAVLLEKRDADERAKAKEPAAGDASSAQGQEDATMVHGATEGGPMEIDKPASWTVDDESITDWIAELELMETRLQCLLLLALVALPPPSVLPRKPKKKHDPERHAATLDPELLLDFLTDRLQIWRVEKAVKTMVANVVSVSDPQLSQPSADGGANASGDAVAGKVLEKDEVHDWWDDIVEPLFSPRVPTAVLLLHREKLFPPTALPKPFSPTLAPAPLARDRTLLSLDKSARRKNTDNDKAVSESPTMKRLLGLGGNHDNHQASMIGGDLSFIPLEEGDVFKVPAPPKKRGTTAVASDADPAPSSTAAPATISAAPIPEASSSDQPPTKARRKQERPRPLPRGDSRIVASSKGLFNRREVSLPRRPGVPAPRAAKKSFGGAELVDTSRAHSQPPGEAGAAGGGGRKRKALSPRKLKTSESLSHFTGASTSSLTLVPDTPLKVASLPRSFSRTQSLPSFAALGAAFRPGSTSDPFVLHGAVGPPRGGMVAGCGPGRGGSVFPPAPILPGEKEGAEEMEWERGVWRDRGEEGMGTPVAQRTGWVVPDT